MPDEKKYDLTIQQEADLAQSANEWINLLIEKKLVNPFNHAPIAAVLARAMRDTAVDLIKDNTQLRTTLKETGEHLSKIAIHGVKLEARGIELSKLLTISNAITDEAAKALDVMSRQACECPTDLDTDTTEHNEGCSVRISQDALDAIKVMMEKIDA